MKGKLDSFKDEQDAISRRLHTQRELFAQKQRSIEELSQNLDLFESAISGMKQELASELQTDLNQQEFSELEFLGSKSTQLSETLVSISKEKSSVESEKGRFRVG